MGDPVTFDSVTDLAMFRVSAGRSEPVSLLSRLSSSPELQASKTPDRMVETKNRIDPLCSMFNRSSLGLFLGQCHVD